MTRALVTGAGIRLGRAMALYLAQRGYDVAVHYATSEQPALETVAEVQAMGRNAVALQADLLNEAQVSDLLPRAIEALGKDREAMCPPAHGRPPADGSADRASGIGRSSRRL